MKKFVLFLVCILTIATQNTYAQDQTRGQETGINLELTAQKSLLVVPMMDKMFLSNVGTQLGRANQLNFREMRELLIDKINENTVLSASGIWDASDAKGYNDTLVEYFHMAIGFNYDEVTVHSAQEETKIQEFWQQLQEKTKTQTTAKNGAYLDKGEIKEFYDKQERFMNASLDSAFTSHEIFQSIEQDYVLIINELDIYKPNPNEVNYGSGERTLKLHFTLYSKEGKRIYGNATFATFDKSELDIYEIINSALFSAVNRMVAECTAQLNISPIEQ